MVPRDVRSVAAIEEAEPSAWPVRLIEAELTQENSHCFVACLDHVVVGWSCARHGADEAELFKIGVEVKHRRKAIGSALLKFVATHLRGVGICQIFLEVRFQNKAARSFYRRAGFTEIHRRINYYN
jgi:ribosomal-protein-alanine acetyltransferase